LISRRPRSTLCPYTTLFRSLREFVEHLAGEGRDDGDGSGGTPGELGGELVGERPRQQLAGHGASLLGRASKFRPLCGGGAGRGRSEEHTSELQSRENLVCRL